MDQRPIFLQGRGRGRGRGMPVGITSSNAQAFGSQGEGNPVQKRDNQWNGLNTHAKQVNSMQRSACQNGSSGSNSPSSPLTAEERFQNITSQHEQSRNHHLNKQSPSEEYITSSEEDDDDANEDRDASIMSSILKEYKGTSEQSNEILGRTEDYLLNSFKSKANVCLICIETIRKNDAIWNCQGCYTMFHVTCIQKWVKDGVYKQIVQLDDDNIEAKTLPWHCPKCRQEYMQSECPTRYHCFCLKEEDPVFDPWLVPHSCGQTCEKQLKPECGHRCLLLCHPGPCPPCPQTVRTMCFCRQTPEQTRRCGAKEWSCGLECSKPLACGHHNCKAACHQGECPPCPETSLQPCLCGSSSVSRPCASPEWQCTKVCNKQLSCGNHTCEKLCHANQCGDCPRSGKRFCPCSKTEFNLPCTEDVPTCPDTCGKLLECQLHTCTQRCHNGTCGTCRQLVEKRCRCGQKSKDVLCFKEYTCETKCQRMKDCGKHQCKRKCCNGDCPPCEQLCNRALRCRNHKCSSRCHMGPCYPCPQTVTLNCNCQKTSIVVPCGREKVTKPPRCNLPCRKPPDCHHASRLKHRCHFKRCPPCKQECAKTHPACGHTCPSVCHTAVFTTIEEKVTRSGPWEPAPEKHKGLVDKECPPCEVLVKVSCLGGHEVVKMKCHEAKVTSCHRKCGLLLACTNHTCELECHKIDVSQDEDAENTSCEQCERPCEQERPEGCNHPCPMPCHAGDCPPCIQMIRMRCHCGLFMHHVDCSKWTESGEHERKRLKACQSRCPKLLPCNHQCTSFCHAGECPSPEECTEKVRLRCPCRTRKMDYLCYEIKARDIKVECDKICKDKKERIMAEQQEKEKARQEEEERKRQAEIDKFKKQIPGRKRRQDRKKRYEEPNPSFWERHQKMIIASTIVVLFAVLFYYMISIHDLDD